jgi:hypothetical protein
MKTTLRQLALKSSRNVGFFGLALLYLLAVPSALASDVADAKIKTLATNAAYPGVVFVEVVGTKTGTPACHTHASWTYVLQITNADHDRMFALLTAAKLGQARVRLSGNGAYDVLGGVESLSQVWLI